MTYDSLQTFAQTWGLLLLIAFFVIALAYALWPGNKARFDAAARLPLGDDSDGPQEKVCPRKGLSDREHPAGEG